MANVQAVEEETDTVDNETRLIEANSSVKKHMGGYT